MHSDLNLMIRDTIGGQLGKIDTNANMMHLTQQYNDSQENQCKIMLEEAHLSHHDRTYRLSIANKY